MSLLLSMLWSSSFLFVLLNQIQITFTNHYLCFNLFFINFLIIDQWCTRFYIQLDIFCASYRIGFIFHAQPCSGSVKRVSNKSTLHPTITTTTAITTWFLLQTHFLITSFWNKRIFQWTKSCWTTNPVSKVSQSISIYSRNDFLLKLDNASRFNFKFSIQFLFCASFYCPIQMIPIYPQSFQDILDW